MANGKRLKQQKESLARFLAYMLGHRPDEFGLAPDENGFVTMKDLLHALSEEEGWRAVREGNIMELLREPDGSGLEIKDKLVRAHPGVAQLPPVLYEWAAAPKLLFHAARRKGYPVILKEGLRPLGNREFVVLADSENLARRIGRRRDPDPVMLTVLAEQAETRGVVFNRFLEHIYTVDALTSDLFTGPPLPKEKPEKDKKKKEKQTDKDAKAPGSFAVRPEYIFDASPEKLRSKKDKKKRSDVPDWKRDARKDRRKRGEDEF